MERKLTGFRGCIIRGGIDMNDFSHCGNEKCVSCNRHRDVLQNVMEKFVSEIKIKLEEKNNGNIENNRM